MYRFRFALLPVLAGWTLSGCGGDAPAEGEEGLTAAEERQLDEAAQRLDRAREDYEAGMAAQARADAAADAARAGSEPPGGSQ